MHNIFILFSLILPLLYVDQASAGVYPQYLQVYTKGNCSGANSAILYESNPDIPSTGNDALKFPKSVSTRGVWRWTTTDGEVTTEVFKHGYHGCSTHPSSTYELQSAINLLPYDLDDSALALFPGIGFSGDNVTIITTTDRLSFNGTQVNFKSWALTGVENYLLYEGSNFDGAAVCISVHFAVENFGWGVSSHNGVGPIELIPVGSVKRGCSVAKN